MTHTNHTKPPVPPQLNFGLAGYYLRHPSPLLPATPTPVSFCGKESFLWHVLSDLEKYLGDHTGHRRVARLR